MPRYASGDQKAPTAPAAATPEQSRLGLPARPGEPPPAGHSERSNRGVYPGTAGTRAGGLGFHHSRRTSTSFHGWDGVPSRRQTSTQSRPPLDSRQTPAPAPPCRGGRRRTRLLGAGSRAARARSAPPRASRCAEAATQQRARRRSQSPGRRSRRPTRPPRMRVKYFVRSIARAGAWRSPRDRWRGPRRHRQSQ